ncbi:tyrosine-type recombinase/integrase [Cnuibacter sp. UC19_7]|uniref:site-specific integrase n=1 Tax=Cnuibacter sp. UC19_7 TaxID=3350166 RepID=UPI00366A84F0
MATISSYQTAAGKRYRVRYRTPDHRQTDKRGFKSKKDAELFAASIEIKKATGEFIDAAAGRVTMTALGADWIATQSHLKPSSFRPVEIAWRLHVEPRWGSRRVGDIRHSEVQTWVSELTSAGKSATTVLLSYGVLASILDVAVRDRRLPSNPARNVKLPRKLKREHRYLTHAQVIALADNAGDRRALVLLLAYTGLRWGEAIGLRVKDVDLVRRRVTVSENAVEVDGQIIVGTPKTHKRRQVPFPRFMVGLLREAIKGKGRDALVFSDAYGFHLRRTRVSTGSRSWFKTALEHAGLEPMTLHDLRHTAASLSIASGANVKAVQRMLGHASAAMTLDTYADLFDDDLDVLAARLDEAAASAIVGKTWAGSPARNDETP